MIYYMLVTGDLGAHPFGVDWEIPFYPHRRGYAGKKGSCARYFWPRRALRTKGEQYCIFRQSAWLKHMA